MRCRRCQRAISGIGKPAVALVIPAAIAFAGGIGGLWSLHPRAGPFERLAPLVAGGWMGTWPWLAGAGLGVGMDRPRSTEMTRMNVFILSSLSKPHAYYLTGTITRKVRNASFNLMVKPYHFGRRSSHPLYCGRLLDTCPFCIELNGIVRWFD